MDASTADDVYNELNDQLNNELNDHYRYAKLL
jgi:hypothetical protein